MILIFSGYNQRAIIAFLRTLESNNITQYRIIAASPQDTILKTKYKSNVYAIRSIIELDLTEICELVDQIYCLDTSAKVLLAPTTEALNRFFLKYRSILELHNSIIPLVDEDFYIKISDKQSFWELCKLYHFEVPRQEKRFDRIPLPIVAKPKTYISENGKNYAPIIIQSEKDLELFCCKFPVEDFVFQEFINGNSYYLLYYFSQNGSIYCLSQRNLAQQPGGKSMIAAKVSRLHERAEIAAQYKYMFRTLGFHGFLMIELRETTKKYYMIEANPRFWGPSQLFCNSGYNFFEFFLNDYGYLNSIPNRQVDYNAKYLWSGGVKGELFDSNACVWLEGGEEYVYEHFQEFLESDIYRHEDTIRIYEAEHNEI